MQATNSQLLPSSLNPDTKNILIEERFLLRRLLSKKTYYNIYEGIDLQAYKPVTIYIKPVRLGRFSPMWI